MNYLYTFPKSEWVLHCIRSLLNVYDVKSVIPELDEQ